MIMLIFNIVNQMVIIEWLTAFLAHCSSFHSFACIVDFRPGDFASAELDRSELQAFDIDCRQEGTLAEVHTPSHTEDNIVMAAESTTAVYSMLNLSLIYVDFEVAVLVGDCMACQILAVGKNSIQRVV